MTTQPTRRGFLAAAAWTVPTVAIVTAAPAYATSTPTACSFTGQRVAKPGRGKGSNRWVYQVRVTCAGRVEVVTINGKAATSIRGDLWSVALPGKHHTLPVSVVTSEGVVAQAVRFA